MSFDSNSPIDDDERVSHYIVQSDMYRKDGALKPKFFPPNNKAKLSVDRSTYMAEDAIWASGDNVARKRGKRLYGRVDSSAKHYRDFTLDFEPEALDDNPYHANIIGWPIAKEDRRNIIVEMMKLGHFKQIDKPGIKPGSRTPSTKS